MNASDSWLFWISLYLYPCVWILFALQNMYEEDDDDHETKRKRYQGKQKMLCCLLLYMLSGSLSLSVAFTSPLLSCRLESARADRKIETKNDDCLVSSRPLFCFLLVAFLPGFRFQWLLVVAASFTVAAPHDHDLVEIMRQERKTFKIVSSSFFLFSLLFSLPSSLGFVFSGCWLLPSPSLSLRRMLWGTSIA